MLEAAVGQVWWEKVPVTFFPVNQPLVDVRHLPDVQRLQNGRFEREMTRQNYRHDPGKRAPPRTICR
jgi:hypothetical protein